jgi:hypothetical protein
MGDDRRESWSHYLAELPVTTPRSLLWCSALVVFAGAGAAYWSRAPSAPPSTKATRNAAPRSAHSEMRALERPPRFERLEPEPQGESLPLPHRERQPIERDAPPTPDAGAAPRVVGVSSAGPAELANDVSHDVIPGTAARHPPLEQVQVEIPSDEPEPEERPPPRRVELSVFRVWQQPGLCAKPEAASEAHGSLMRRFRVVDGEGDGDGRFYVDPRLPEGAESSLSVYLEAAERQARAELGLTAQRPDVFVYHDLELLLAAACTNEDVVAYYDGALHVVLNRDDVRESVLHEYAHHALMTNGMLGPTWAQEGIAMHVANETWWRTRQWLGRVADKPFSIDVMEREVPYTLSSEQAVLFYVQAGAMVACAAREQPEGLGGLARALGASQSGGELSYALDAPTTPAALRACVGRLLRGTGGEAPRGRRLDG